MPLVISPLRERPEDILPLSDFLLEDIKRTLGKKEIGGFTDDAISVLNSYNWPGNTRELRNVIERAAILCQKGDISARYLILPDKQALQKTQITLEEIERTHIMKVLQMTEGNRTRAAQLLGIARSTLNQKIKMYDLD
jgi:DNA-binding NtrC family response regulator